MTSASAGIRSLSVSGAISPFCVRITAIPRRWIFSTVCATALAEGCLFHFSASTWASATRFDALYGVSFPICSPHGVPLTGVYIQCASKGFELSNNYPLLLRSGLRLTEYRVWTRARKKRLRTEED